MAQDTEARRAAIDFIMAKEQAENFRDPDRAQAKKDAGKPTATVDLALSDSYTRSQAQQDLDAIAAGSQEQFRQATQRLVLEEQGAEAGAAAIGQNTLNQMVRDRMKELLESTASGIGYDAPSLGKGVV